MALPNLPRTGQQQAAHLPLGAQAGDFKGAGAAFISDGVRRRRKAARIPPGH